VVLVVFGRVDSALSRNAVGATGAIVKAKTCHLVPELSQGRGRAGPSQSRPHHNNGDPPFIVRTHQLFTESVSIPFALQWPGRNFWIKDRHRRTIPRKTARTIETFPRTTRKATAGPAILNSRLNAPCSSPSVCKLLETAWLRWKPSPNCPTR